MLEYVGITIVVAGVIVALMMTTVPSDIQAGFANGVCRIINPGDPDCQDKGGATASPDPGDQGEPTTGPTGGETGQNTGAPTTDPVSDESQLPPDMQEYNKDKEAADAANKELEDAEEEWGNLDEELLGLVADLVGWTSAKDCFTKGDIGACLETLLTAIPWGKLLKAAKMIPKIWKLFRRWQKLQSKLNKARKAKKKANDKLKKAKDACGGKKGNSFTAGTLVVLADGTNRPIESISPGDRVLAGDPSRGADQARTVTHLITGYGTKRLVEVTFDRDGEPGGATATLTATDNHPFWLPEAGIWADAGDLVRGDLLHTSGGGLRPVVGLRERTEVRSVHNLSVDGPHTYYVSATGQRVLVHNDDPPNPSASGSCPINPIPDKPPRAKPDASLPKLKNIINDLYKGTKYPDGQRIGDGTAMDAARFELETGRKVQGRDHVGKLQEYKNALKKVTRTEQASGEDKKIAQDMLTEIDNILP